MFDLFDDTPQPDVEWHPAWLAPEQAAAFFERIAAEAPWRQERIRTPGGYSPRLRIHISVERSIEGARPFLGRA